MRRRDFLDEGELAGQTRQIFSGLKQGANAAGFRTEAVEVQAALVQLAAVLTLDETLSDVVDELARCGDYLRDIRNKKPAGWS